MAQYPDEGSVHPVTGPVFDEIYSPGDSAPYSGIYRCQARGCRREIVALEGKALPSEDDHQHEQQHGRIGWKLIVLPD